MFGSPVPRALLAALSGIISLVLVLLVAALFAAEGKNQYELLKDLFVPLIGPVVAVLIPLVVLYVIPSGQSREKFALDLCAQYYHEEMRIARNTPSQPEMKASPLATEEVAWTCPFVLKLQINLPVFSARQ